MRLPDYFECRLIKYANQYNVHPERINGTKHDEVLKKNTPSWSGIPKNVYSAGCVRICEEVMGVTALGLVNRGFESIVCRI